MYKFVATIVVASVAIATPVLAHSGEPFSAEQGKPIGRSSVLNGPNGLDVDAVDGNVYVASVIGDEITVHNPRNGAILDRIGPERGVHGPDDIVIAPDGIIYWTEILAGNVGMLDRGSYLVKFVGEGTNPITLSDDGRLFVARDFLGDGLYELDPETLAVIRVVIPDLVGFNGMDFGPDGLLYGPLFFGQAIVRVDVDVAIPDSRDRCRRFPRTGRGGVQP